MPRQARVIVPDFPKRPSRRTYPRISWSRFVRYWRMSNETLSAEAGAWQQAASICQRDECGQSCLSQSCGVKRGRRGASYFPAHADL